MRTNEEMELLDQQRAAIVEKYAAKGITVSASWNDKGGIGDIELAFTNDEWIDLLDTEGEFLPACCGNISEVRDHLFDAIRHSRFISGKDLRRCYELLIGHGCDEDHEDKDHPINRLIQLWLAVAEDVHIESSDITFDYEALHGPVKAALITIRQMIHNFSWPVREEDQQLCHAYAVYRMVPALKLLCNDLENKYPDTADGFALCCGDKILETHTGIGLAIYGDLKTANEVCSHWNEYLEETPATVRPVIISVKDGISFKE